MPSFGIALGDRLEEQDRPSDGGVERADSAAHRDPHQQITPFADGWPETLALAPDDDRDRPSEIGLARGQRCIGLGSSDPQSTAMEIGESRGEIVDRAEEEMLYRSRRGLDGGWRERRLTPGREDHAMDPGRFGAAQKGTDVLRVLERVEHEEEWWFISFRGTREDVLD